MAITFNEIGNTIGEVTKAREAAMQDTLTNMNEDPSTADMLRMQQQLQQWTIMTQVQSTITKELGDTLKGIIQKAA